MPADRPVVFLAFADARSDLSSLKVEGWSLKDQFDELKQRGVIADIVVEEKASLERIYSVFQKYRDRIALFHFGGHADGDRLLLQSAFEPRPAYADGLATLLGQQRGLKLVFLNGCSTRPQVKRLLDAGVPAVIATARPIDDHVATEFAMAFYQALTTGYSGENRKITGGCSLAMAFAQAEGLSEAARRNVPRLRRRDTRPRGRHRRYRFPLEGAVSFRVRALGALEPVRGRSPVRTARPARRHRLARRAVSQPGVPSVRPRPDLLRSRPANSRAL